MRHQTITNGQQCVGAGGITKTHIVLQDTNNDPTDDVDECNQQARYRVSAHKLGCAVHCPEKGRFILKTLTTGFCLFLVNQTRIEIGINRHLFARHGIKCETRRNFCDTTGTLGDDDEVHNHQNRKHDNADNEIAPHGKLPKGLDDMPCRTRSGVTIGEDQPGGCHVQSQPQHGRDQQHGWKDGEFKGCCNKQRDHQDQH